MSQEHYFNDKSAILLHPGKNKNFASQRQSYVQRMQDAQVTKSVGMCLYQVIMTLHFLSDVTNDTE